jgi:two-component system chemotaxis sensor kinase CheA
MDDLLQEFISETQETLEALASEVIAWEADPTDRDRLDAIFRFFHTVKGSCGFLNLPRFERLSHAAEDVLSEIRAGDRVPDPATVSAVLAVMDRIGELAEAVSSGASLPNENDDYLVQSLRQVADAPAADEPVAALPAAPLKREGPSPVRSIRLPLTLIDQLMNGISDMVLARNELSRKLRDRMSEPDLDSAFERLSTCVADMRDAISKTRMQRVDRLFAAIPRMVRDLGRELGKTIELQLEGGDVEMDREMVEMVVDPLTHIVRNSIDHGIETPARRLAAGKAEAGHLRISARQSGNQIVIEVSDDGQGIDTLRLVDKAIASGALTTEAAMRLSEQQKVDLIFAAGLSTAEQITAISGRGVGMDVVRANVERIGGVIALDNRPGRGLTITLRVPLTLTIIPGLIVRAGGQHFAIPRAAVVEILHDTNEMLDVACVGGACIATIRGIRHSMIDLEDVLGLPVVDMNGQRTIMVVRSSSGIPFAMGVTAVENHEELVIRPASPLIMASGVYAGMTLPDNGQPMLLLDAGGLANAACLPNILDDSMDHTAGEQDAATIDVGTVGALRFVELTGEERLLKLSLIERVEDIDASLFGCSGERGFVRIEGRLLPVANDHYRFDSGTITALRLRDGEAEVYYPVARVVDIVQMPTVPDMILSRGTIAGVAVVDGTHFEVVDAFALFALLADEIEDNGAGRCVLADGDDIWAQEILAPLLRQAGHLVIFGLPEDGVMHANDIVLRTQQESETVISVDRPVIHLRSAKRGKNASDPSIYRYDREALMAAIEAARKERAA